MIRGSFGKDESIYRILLAAGGHYLVVGLVYERSESMREGSWKS